MAIKISTGFAKKPPLQRVWCTAGALAVALGLSWWSGSSQAQDYVQNQPGSTTLQMRSPQVKGSQTLGTFSRGALSYLPSSATAQKAGSAFVYRNGFGCEGGRRWALVKGEIQCAGALDLGGGGGFFQAGGRTLYVRGRLIDGWRTGTLMRVTGTTSDLRVDMFSVNGNVTASCFVTAAEPTCHVGSPGGVHGGLAAVPQFLSNGQMRHASDLVSGNMLFSASTACSSAACEAGGFDDAYIASVTVTASHLDFHIVGLHYLNGSRGMRLNPVYSSGRLNWDSLQSMMTGVSELTWLTTSAWSANTP
jgi:hypothetical protein